MRSYSLGSPGKSKKSVPSVSSVPLWLNIPVAGLSMTGQPEGQPKYEVVACIGGRGFGVRREDMKKMLLATRGKVFTLKTMDRLVECSRLKEFRTV